MNYELTNQLKDAGFPLHSNENISVFNVDDVIYATPTLSELIEACGEDLKQIDRILQWKEKPDWFALSHSINPDSRRDIGEFGKTPEEAVARLWLALNK